VAIRAIREKGLKSALTLKRARKEGMA